jgi:lipid-A-disaccharide synthase
MIEKRILIIAGEASSDLHAANLIKEIKRLAPQVIFFGLGGEKMKQAGCEIDCNIVELAVIGFFEVIKNLSKFRKIFHALLEKIDRSPPALAILVDYPGFNLKLAEELKKRKIPIIYFISPQVWAWGKNRIKTIKRLIDHMLVLFKFEEELYQKASVPVTFIGHPLLDLVKPKLSKQEFFAKFKLRPSKYTISLLPGSRLREVNAHLPIMLKSAGLIKEKLKDVQFLLLRATTIRQEVFDDIISNYSLPLCVISDATYEGLSASDFSLVASGTATLETAILKIPMVIIYKVSFLSWLLLKTIIHLPYIGLVNIIANQKIVPEFIQYQAKPKNIASYITNTLVDSKHLYTIKQLLSKIESSLGEPQATQRAAHKILEFLNHENKTR